MSHDQPTAKSEVHSVSSRSYAKRSQIQGRFLLCLAAVTAVCCALCGRPQDGVTKDCCRHAEPATTTTDSGLAAAPFPDAAERRALYLDLVAAVHKYHVFSEQTAANLGLSWEESLRALEPVFVEARDEAALRMAVKRLASSLHDPHLGYEFEQPEERLDLGLSLQGIWHSEGPEFRIESVSAPHLEGRVQRGDKLVSIDDIAAEELPRLYLDRTKWNNWPAVTWAVARFLTQRSADGGRTRLGASEHWRLRRAGAAAPYDLELRWERASSGAKKTSPELLTDPDYSPAHCYPHELSERRYSLPGVAGVKENEGYRVTGYGHHFCLYTAEKPPYRYYPIIRHFTFFYYPGMPRDHEEDARFNNAATYTVAADYFTLSRLLRARPETRGLILDLRDNGGGNDPEWFLDWYAPAPYEDQYITLRVGPEWLEPSFTDRVVNIDADWLKWYRQASEGAAVGTWLKRPFKCLRPDCTGPNLFSPARALLKVPVALLVGRGCGSSCAHLADIFDENDFGPLIGEPSQATQTAQAYSYPVRTRSGLALGHIKLALSTAISGKTGRRLEGSLPFIDYPIPKSFGNHDSLDAAHVAAALRAFKEYRFPKHVAPLGP